MKAVGADIHHNRIKEDPLISSNEVDETGAY